MPDERQQQITIQQVLARMDEARNRADRSMQKAMNCNTNEEYNHFLNQSIKAANDYNTWRIVLDALKGGT